MQTKIELKFADINEYRKAISRILLERLAINISNPQLKVLEIGPGSQSELVETILKSSDPGEGFVVIEPHLASAEVIKAKLPKCKIIGSKIEMEVQALPSGYFDLVFANFSLHWSDRLSDVVAGIFEALKKNGEFAFTITDPSRSFWARRNQEFKAAFPGCDLFNAPEAKSLGPLEWKDLLLNSGFTLKEEIVFEGVASASPNADVILENFRKACGDKYLKLSGQVTREMAEKWILEKLESLRDESGLIPVPASGLSFIATKSK